jgi:hypothetical protein
VRGLGGGGNAGSDCGDYERGAADAAEDTEGPDEDVVVEFFDQRGRRRGRPPIEAAPAISGSRVDCGYSEARLVALDDRCDGRAPEVYPVVRVMPET